ncbi:MAG: hypothetical protein KJ725_04325 [Gammaproteobacteria bacterium]|jgi:hypothetical protein|uniref:hypothetical protein n=1 Tax=Methylotuvimicrobium sp. TaxID=2822413 RepID=UPI001D472BEA|nr:hypothetical protein [Gammaproteobacteria bacterium]
MKVFLLFSGSGTMVVMTDRSQVDDPSFLAVLAGKGVEKFVVYEIPVPLARERYGHHFEKAEQELSADRPLRVLDYNGERAMRLFRFAELGAVVMHEPEGYTEQKSF